MADTQQGYAKRPLWQWILLYIVIGGLVYVLIYYFVYKRSGYNYNQSGSGYHYPTSTQVPTQPTSVTSPSSTSQATQVTVVGTEFAFTPSTVTLKAGQPVQLTFKNAGQYPHNFTVSELNIQTKTIQPGQEDTITFTPSKTGSFTYVCTVPGHEDRGMKGTLVVQ